ncbi:MULTISPECIES: hypothetical protein [unclassified Microbacterium]|uniref:hypothetical protein n=1 Tax=unclassified Microbacterium TaxID=2609290 RepID=UPI000EAAB6E9|nr:MULTISPECIES: hypothetical protein [unclassified Microbacterium]MBT2485385.1 hypothetical protein [Microbacterium sp. ISL-108]RKN68188.1 hypothetical protein D7252_11745 [Microbacterium sp. CGR2]
MSHEPLARSHAVQSLVDLENAAPDELFEILPGSTVPFWAQVRMRFALALSAQTTGSLEVDTNNWSRTAELRRLSKAFLPSRWDARLRARPHEVLFYVGGGTTSAEGDRARNWLVEDFAESADSIVVQRRPIPSADGYPSFSPTVSMEAASARSRLWARGYRPPSQTMETIDRLVDFYGERLGVGDPFRRKLRALVLRSEAHRPHELAELRRVVRRVRPRVVIMDTASYTYNGESVGVFKDAGALVVEPQHGWIGPSHAAYNYGRAFDEASLRRALPDELLTFGRFWSESIDYPSRVTAVGKPHLERRAAVAARDRPKTVLVVSSRAEPDQTDAFVLALRSALPAEWEVTFRPHPAERGEVILRYPRLSVAAGVSVDTSADVYDSLSKTKVVVGVASTVLFEAVAFGCVVVARDNDFASTIIGDIFGPRVVDAAEAAKRVLDAQDERTSASAPDPDIWASDSIETFRGWLSTTLAARAS